LVEDRLLLTGGVTLGPSSNVTVLAGAPLQVPINAIDVAGDPLTYSVSSSNPAVSVSLPVDNPDLVLNVSHTSSGQPGDFSVSGTMVIELFKHQAPNTVSQIVSLTNQGFYNGSSFYRIANHPTPFVIQGGAPTPQDSGITVPQIDDEFSPDLRYTSAGNVGVARLSAHDTNTSHFFITADSEPFLDYQYTIFGKVVWGDDVRAKIQSLPTSSDQPLSPVTITSASITLDRYNLALEISAPAGTTGSSTVTVTASDGHGGITQQTIQVNVQPNPNDPAPFLERIAHQFTTANTPLSFQLPYFDLLGDPVSFYSPTSLQQQFGENPTQPISPNLLVVVNQTTGVVTATPTNGLAGVQPMFFGVSNSPPQYYPDTQMVPLFIDPAAPTSISLLATFDSGVSSSDGITSLNNSDSGHELKFMVTGVTPGDSVVILDNGQQIGSTVAQSSSVVVSTDGSHILSDGPHTITAQQILKNQVYTVGNSSGEVDLASGPSEPTTVVVDSVSPTATVLPLGGSPLLAPVSQMTLIFSEPVRGFGLANLSLTADGGPNLLGPGQTLTTTDYQTFVLHNLASLTDATASYRLTLITNGGTITDIAGNPLTVEARTTFDVIDDLYVTNGLDSGPGSLRQAILDAKSTPWIGRTIFFTIPAGQQTITLTTPLPAISNPVDFVLDETQSVAITSDFPTIATDSYNALFKEGDGLLTLGDLPTFGGNIEVNGGVLRLNPAGTPTIAQGVTVSVIGTGSLELAGNSSSLNSGTTIQNVSAAVDGVHVSGHHQIVGGIDGTGNLVVDAGNNLTAGYVIQNALAIGGTATSFGMVTIAASDASGNPLNSVTASDTSTAIDATIGSPKPALSTAASVSAVAAAPTLTSTTASLEPPISVAVAANSRDSSGSALVVKSNFSDSAGLIALQSSRETGGVPDIAFPVSNEGERSSSLTTSGVASTSDTATFLERQTAIVANGNGEPLRRDAVAAAFADADVLEWAASTPAARPSAADADITLLSDDLLDAIGRQWHN